MWSQQTRIFLYKISHFSNFVAFSQYFNFDNYKKLEFAHYFVVYKDIKTEFSTFKAKKSII